MTSGEKKAAEAMANAVKKAQMDADALRADPKKEEKEKAAEAAAAAAEKKKKTGKKKRYNLFRIVEVYLHVIHE